ncbi:MAG: lasso peptide biosynthesis B2 protein [Pseudonocardiaceae bacterium]
MAALPVVTGLGNGHLLVLAPTGRIYQFNPAAASMCAVLQEHQGDVSAAARTISTSCDVNTQRVEHDLQALITGLGKAGLTPGALLMGTADQDGKSSPEMAQDAVNARMAVLPRTSPGVAATVTGLAVGMAVRLALQTLPFRHLVSILQRLAGTTRRPAGRAEVAAALDIVDAGATWLPVRVACLERSVAAVLLLAARRRGATWQVGARTPPLALHAWLADADGPIGEPACTSSYQPVITITPAGRSSL